MPTDWEARYREGDTPWDRGAAAPPLLEWLEIPAHRFAGEVMVPGCGLGHDVRAIAEAVNSGNKLLFAGYPGGDTTTVRGPAAGVSPATEANFNSNSLFGGAGSYQIDLTSAATATNPNAVPEPSTRALVFTSIVGIALFALRRWRLPA